MSKVVYILDRFASKNPLYNTWIDQCPQPCKVVQCPPQDWEVPDDAGLVMTHEHFRWETISALRRILEKSKIPILILSDGILEFRNTWQNPTIADGSVYQTIFGHKIACIGRAPARTIESFGNTGLCEIVGHPRFDQMYECEHLPVQDTGPFRLLVTTARTPAFNDQQHRQVIQGLTELKNRLARNDKIAERHVEVNWRLSDALLNELSLPIPELSHKLPSLGDTIEMSDAVITTPSTVFLESLIKRRPTALLDFTNSPAYVPAAWRITATAHINPVLEELALPPAAKMLFQRAVLRDQVELGQNSKQRLFALIGEMIKAGQQASKSGESLYLPARILSDPQRGIARVEDNFDMSSLFPNSPMFRNNDVALLQQELVHAIARLEQLPLDLHDRDENILRKSEHIASMTASLEHAESRIQKANRRVDESAERQKESRDFIEIQREKIAELYRQISHLKSVQREPQTQLQLMRDQLHQRSNEILAAAANLTKEVQKACEGIEPKKDQVEQNQVEQKQSKQAEPKPDQAEATDSK